MLIIIINPQFSRPSHRNSNLCNHNKWTILSKKITTLHSYGQAKAKLQITKRTKPALCSTRAIWVHIWCNHLLRQLNPTQCLIWMIDPWQETWKAAISIKKRAQSFWIHNKIIIYLNSRNNLLILMTKWSLQPLKDQPLSKKCLNNSLWIWAQMHYLTRRIWLVT